MKFVVKNRGEKDWMLFEVNGFLDLDKSKQMIDKSDELEEIVPGIGILIDCTKVETFDITQDDIVLLAEHFNKISDRSGRTALVTGPQDDRHTLGMMYEIMVKDFEGRMVKVFYNTDEALAWLLEE